MNKSNPFQDTIKAYLDKRAAEDSLFAVTYAKENKNIKDCCSYITSQAKKAAKLGNCAVIEDDIVFGWAVHYYDEDDIKVENSSNMHVAVNNSVSKTEVKKEVPKAKVKPNKKEDINQLSLF